MCFREKQENHTKSFKTSENYGRFRLKGSMLLVQVCESYAFLWKYFHPKPNFHL